MILNRVKNKAYNINPKTGIAIAIPTNTVNTQTTPLIVSKTFSITQR